MKGGENSFERQKDADESTSKDINYSGQASDEVWFGVPRTKEEGRKKLRTTEMRMLRIVN